MKEFPQRGNRMPASRDVEIPLQATRRGEDFLPDTERDDRVKRAQDGSLSAIRELYLDHHEHIFRFIWSRVHDPDLAEDLTGEVFVRMVTALSSYHDRSLPFRAWLYRIARNLVIDWYRKKSRQMSVPLDAQRVAGNLIESQSPEETTEQALTLERVRQALERIDPTQREVVELRFLAGLSLKDVALAIGKTIAAVKALQHRGLASLRASLKE
jgi:RNA polymerase sigma-70 factor (ECF subfamily)